jgi:fructokinase
MRIGIDVGGTKIEAIAMDDKGHICRRQRIGTPRGDYEATLRALVDLVDGFRRELQQPCSIGIGIPGMISPSTGLVTNANSVWLIGKPLGRDLERLLRQPVRFSNDANCFALSEAVDGAGAGHAVVFGVIIGTGTGGGIVVRGRVVEGRHGIAGEWGHNPLPWPERDEWPGPGCYCGRTGCIETFLSGPGLARAYHLRTAQVVDALEVTRRAAAHDREAAQLLEKYEQRMARALASVINVLDPDVIVLGGGLSNIDRLYANVPRLWAPFVFSDRVATPLVKATHGDSSGARGAAWLW